MVVTRADERTVVTSYDEHFDASVQELIPAVTREHREHQQHKEQHQEHSEQHVEHQQHRAPAATALVGHNTRVSLARKPAHEKPTLESKLAARESTLEGAAHEKTLAPVVNEHILTLCLPVSRNENLF